MHRAFIIKEEEKVYKTNSSDLNYKSIKIANDDSRIVSKFEASLTDDARVVIYNHHMFIVQAT